MPSYYEHNYRAFGDQVLRAGFMEAAMRARAEAVEEAAVAASPVDSGRYANSFEVSTAITAFGGKETRWGARVTNTAPYALWIEFGYGPAPRYRVLGRSLYAAGGDVKVGRL